MNKTLQISNIGSAGINSDIAAWELGPEFITNGENFRVRGGSMQPLGGTRTLSTSPGDPTAGFVMHIRIKSGDYWLQATRHSIYVSSRDASWANASSQDYNLGIGGELDWSACQLGQVVVTNNPGFFPEYWAITTQGVLKPLPFRPNPDTPDDLDTAISWEDLGYTCKVMRSHKNFLIAMNLGGSDDLPNGYRISNPADANGIPYSWDTDDRSSIAIKAQLGGDGAEILDGRSLRDNFIIYSRDSMDALTFNPSSEFYWSRKELSTTVGLLNTNCLVEVKGSHFLIVDGDVVVNDGTNIRSIMYNKIQRRFNSRANEWTAENSFVARNDVMKEVWFCTPEDQNQYANIAYVYNWKDDSWSIRDLPNTVVGADYGANPFYRDPESFSTWRHAQGKWSELTKTWGSVRLTPLNDVMAGLDTDGNLFDIDPKNAIDEDSFGTMLERTNFPLETQRGNNTIVRAYPTAYGDPFEIQFGSQQKADGPVEWQQMQVFDPGNDRKIDFRTTGELMAWRVRSIADNRFRLSGMQVEYVPSGYR